MCLRFDIHIVIIICLIIKFLRIIVFFILYFFFFYFFFLFDFLQIYFISLTIFYLFMSTKNQSISYKFKRVTIYKKPKLDLSPQRKCVVMRLRICTPRKPNSARRPVIKGVLSTFKKVLAHIPGSGHTLRRHSRVLINGNAARDLPVVNYTCIRGVYDFEPLSTKKKRRSIYGVSLPSDLRKHVRRNIRHLV